MIRVVIADDNAVIRHGLASMLEAVGDITVVAQAANGKEAVAAVRKERPHVVLLDVRMPIMDGVEAAEQLRELTHVLMLTYSDDEWAISGAIRAGAAGYLVHGRFEPDELLQAIRDVAAGGSVLSPAVASTVFGMIREGVKAEAGADRFALTEREFDVMRLVAQGRSNSEIAEDLFISQKTVKNHLNRIYAKMGVERRAEAIAQWLGIKGDTR